MPENTANLDLYLTDMDSDGELSFDFERDLNQNFSKIDTAIGNLTGLSTTAKNNLVAAINELKGTLNNLTPSDINLSSSGTETLSLGHGHYGDFTNTKVLNLPSVTENTATVYCYVKCTVTTSNQLTFGESIVWDSAWNPIGNFDTTQKHFILLRKEVGENFWRASYKYGAKS